MSGAIQSSRVLPSAKLVVADGSLVIINIIGDSLLNRMLYGATNRVLSLFRRYKRKCASAENSIYIPFQSISSVGKKRCSKLKTALMSLAVPAVMALFGLEIGIGLIIALVAVGALLATVFYVVSGNRYALTIEINSGFEYLLTTNDPDFVENVYHAIKGIIDTPEHEEPLVNNITYDFRGATVIDSVVTAKTLGT